MRKVFLQAPPENGAITNYTSEVSRLLRPAVSGEQADKIVGEAQAHLYDQAEAIKARENLSQNEAEARAVAVFTPPVAFAREMARSAVETRFSQTWHKIGKTATVLLLCVWSVRFVVDGAFFVPSLRFYVWLLIYGLFCLLPLAVTGVCLCAFLARRAQTRYLICSFALVATLLFVHNGFFFVMTPSSEEFDPYSISRLRMQQIQTQTDKASLQADSDIQRLSAGLKIYKQKKPTVPVVLRSANGHGYLVPYTIISGMALANTVPKKGHYHAPFAPPTHQNLNETLPSVRAARARWLRDGPAYLAQARFEKDRALRDEAALRNTLQHAGFSASASWLSMGDTLRGGLFLILLDGLFAKLGRAVYLKRRARRERKMAQA